MSIPFRTVSVVVTFEHEGMTVSGCVQVSKTMLTGTLSKPVPRNLPLTQLPMICLQASKTGLVNEDFSGLSVFGRRVAERELLNAVPWKVRNRLVKSSVLSGEAGERM